MSVADQGSDEFAVRAIDLHAVVGPVGDVYVAFRVYSDPRRVVQVSRLGVGAPELDQELAVGREFLHPVVAPISHVDVAIIVHADTPGGLEFALSAALTSPIGDELAILAE